MITHSPSPKYRAPASLRARLASSFSSSVKGRCRRRSRGARSATGCAATSSAGAADGSGVGGLASTALIRIAFDGAVAREAERWDMGARVRAVMAGPDGALWILEDGADGRLLRLVRPAPAEVCRGRDA